MAWSTPRTWAVGEVLSAANMNTYISNDLSAINTVLPQVSGANRYVARMYLAATPAVTINADTAIPFDTVAAGNDPSSMTTTGAAAKITVPVAGWYSAAVSLRLGVIQNVVHGFLVSIWHNGAVGAVGTQVEFNGSLGDGTVNICASDCAIKCAANDTIQGYYYISATATIQAGSAQTFLSVSYVCGL